MIGSFEETAPNIKFTFITYWNEIYTKQLIKKKTPSNDDFGKAKVTTDNCEITKQVKKKMHHIERHAHLRTSTHHLYRCVRMSYAPRQLCACEAISKTY